MVVFDAVVELAPGGGDGAAGPAAGGISSLGVSADVVVGGVGVYLVGFKSADEGVVCGGVIEVYPSGTGVKDKVGVWVVRLPSFSGHPISTDLVSAGEDVHCESTAQEIHAGVPA